MTAYDAESGEQAWRFYIVPGNPADGFENDAMRMTAETWTGEWWKLGGGGNAWHGFTYDAEFDTLYIGTGNSSPCNRKLRSPGGGGRVQDAMPAFPHLTDRELDAMRHYIRLRAEATRD